MPPVLAALLTFIRTLFRSRASLCLENLALRHQLAVSKHTVHRPRLRPTDRLVWAAESVAESVRRTAQREHPPRDAPPRDGPERTASQAFADSVPRLLPPLLHAPLVGPGLSGITARPPWRAWKGGRRS
jgi:hypothetical protein